MCLVWSYSKKYKYVLGRKLITKTFSFEFILMLLKFLECEQFYSLPQHKIFFWSFTFHLFSFMQKCLNQLFVPECMSSYPHVQNQREEH